MGAKVNRWAWRRAPNAYYSREERTAIRKMGQQCLTPDCLLNRLPHYAHFRARTKDRPGGPFLVARPEPARMLEEVRRERIEAAKEYQLANLSVQQMDELHQQLRHECGDDEEDE